MFCQTPQFHKKTSSKQYNRKRRNFRQLLTEEQKKAANIQNLSYDFSCRIIRLFQYLTEDSDYKEYIISKQVFRSGTSIGANIREGQHAQSDADFLSKLSIAYKESDETDYWISLLHDNGYLNDRQYESLHNDINRIVKILSVITKKIKEKVRG